MRAVEKSGCLAMIDELFTKRKEKEDCKTVSFHRLKDNNINIVFPNSIKFKNFSVSPLRLKQVAALHSHRCIPLHFQEAITIPMHL